MKLRLKKHTINLYEGDLERLEALFPSLDKSVALRELLHSQLARIEAEAPTPSIPPKEAIHAERN